MMGPKHYKEVCRILRSHRDRMPRYIYGHLVNEFAHLFARGNPRFDLGKFHAAAGYEPDNCMGPNLEYRNGANVPRPPQDGSMIR